MARFILTVEGSNCQELDEIETGADVDTVGGYIIKQLNRWPRAGDSISLGEKYIAKVVSVQGRKIAQVLIMPVTQIPAWAL